MRIKNQDAEYTFSLVAILTKEIYNHIVAPWPHQLATNFCLNSKHAHTITYTKLYTCDICISCNVGTNTTVYSSDNILNGKTLGTGCFVPGKHNPPPFNGFNMNITWRWIRH